MLITMFYANSCFTGSTDLEFLTVNGVNLVLYCIIGNFHCCQPCPKAGVKFSCFFELLMFFQLFVIERDIL